MRIKRLGAIFLCSVFLLCTACEGELSTTPTEDVNTNEGSPVTTVQVSPKELYKEFLKENLRTYVDIDDSSDSVIRTPPQFNLANQHYAFYDVDKDGTQELLWLFNTLKSDTENQVYSMYTINNGEVKEIPIKKYLFDDKTYYPVLLSDGTLRTTLGFSHVPGYAYAHLINGTYEQTDVLTAPWKTADAEKNTYEHIYYGEEIYTKGWADSSRKIDNITAEEFNRRIANLNGSTAPVKLDVKSLLTFSQENDIPIKWLDTPADKTISVITPKEAPLPRSEGLNKKYTEYLQKEHANYVFKNASYKRDDTAYDTKPQAKQYYAFYDLDGNGDDELFFGKQNENGKIIISYWYNEDVKTQYNRFGLMEAENTRVLSNGLVSAEYVISGGSVQGRILRYKGITGKQSAESGDGYYYLNMMLWTYGQEAALYNYSNVVSDLPDSITPESCERQRAILEDGAKTVELNWQLLENYGQ